VLSTFDRDVEIAVQPHGVSMLAGNL